MGGLRVHSSRRDLLAKRVTIMYCWVPFQESMQREWDQLAQKRGTVFHTSGFRQILLESFPYRCGYQALVDSTGKICGLFPLVMARNLKLQTVGVSLPFVNQVDVCAQLLYLPSRYGAEARCTR